jgi:hypothetical protein
MSPVKRRISNEVDALASALARPPVKRLTQEELGGLLGATGAAVKAWSKRGRIPKWARLRAVQVAAEIGVRESVERLLGGGEKASSSCQGSAGGAGRVSDASSDAAPYEASSAPIRVSPDELERLRVLARRIARTVEDTITGNELGYTPVTRTALADSLEAFATELDRQCGYGVTTDIWRVVAWLRKQPPG